MKFFICQEKIENISINIVIIDMGVKNIGENNRKPL
jgi:hypothetical protein